MKTNKILTYSSIERHRHGMLGAETYLGIVLFMFPLVPILLALFSCFVITLSDKLYTRLFMVGTIVMLSVFLFAVVRWILELLTVYLVGEDGELYRLHISLFWYQTKGCMDLIQPEGMTGNRLMRLLFMIQNIKIALERSGDITFDELIQTGKLTRFSEITKVQDRKKTVSFYANMETNKGILNRKITIRKVYDYADGLVLYLNAYESKGKQAAAKQDLRVRRSVEELLKNKKTVIGKLGRFLFTWSGIMLWLCLFTVNPDLNKLSKMNAGQFVPVTAEVANTKGRTVKAEFVFDEQPYTLEVSSGQVSKSEDAAVVELYVNKDNPYEFFYAATYGVSYKPMIIIYLSVISVYLFSAITQLIIDYFHKNLT